MKKTKTIKTKMYKNHSTVPSFTMEGDAFDGLNDEEYEVEVIVTKKNEKLSQERILDFGVYYNNIENGIVLLLKRNGKIYGSRNHFFSDKMDLEGFEKLCKERLKFITDEIKETENE
mgnify:CR=1 FL=1|jgi:hypothetical protein